MSASANPLFAGLWKSLKQYQRSLKVLRFCHVIYTVSHKNVPTFKLSVTFSNLNRFSKFLHNWKAYEIWLFFIFQGGVVTYLRCGGYCRMCFVAIFIRFPAVHKFWKSVKIWHSYGEFKGVNLVFASPGKSWKKVFECPYDPCIMLMVVVYKSVIMYTKWQVDACLWLCILIVV